MIPCFRVFVSHHTATNERRICMDSKKICYYCVYKLLITYITLIILIKMVSLNLKQRHVLIQILFCDFRSVILQ